MPWSNPTAELSRREQRVMVWVRACDPAADSGQFLTRTECSKSTKSSQRGQTTVPVCVGEFLFKKRKKKKKKAFGIWKQSFHSEGCDTSLFPVYNVWHRGEITTAVLQLMRIRRVASPWCSLILNGLVWTKRQLEYDKILSTIGLLVLGLVSVRGLLQALGLVTGKRQNLPESHWGALLRFRVSLSNTKYWSVIFFFFLFFFGVTKGCFVSHGW